MDIKGRMGGARNTCLGEVGCEIAKRGVLAPCGAMIIFDHSNEQMTTKYHAAMTAHKASCLSPLCAVLRKLLLARHRPKAALLLMQML